MKLDYASLFIAAILTVALVQLLEGNMNHIATFLHGAMVGTSIGCSLLGVILYTRASKSG